MRDLVDGNMECTFYTDLLDLTRSVAKNATIGLLVGIEPAIPVQCYNQLSYRGQLSSSKRMFIY